ncbi:MAG: NAD(P)-dependent oxidoreductase [Candidatus Heimdallarchaeota archaeon]
MRIIITGGEGFIGFAVAEKLIDQGHNVISIDVRNQNSYVDYSRNVDFRKADLQTIDVVNKIVEKADGIIHLGAVSRVLWAEDYPLTCIDVNIKGTLNILKSAKKLDKKPWIIFGSSREVYGETNGERIAENQPSIPINIYGVSKVAAEQLTKSYSHQNNIRSLSLRFSNVYGGLTDILDRVIPRFIINSLLNKPVEIHGGEQIFDFTYIDDTVNGILSAVDFLSNLDEQTPHYDVFNILPGNGNTLYDVVNIIQDSFDHEIKLDHTPKRFYDVEKFVGDPTKAKMKLKFECKTPLKIGINETVKIYSTEYKNNKKKLLRKFQEDSKFVLQ